MISRVKRYRAIHAQTCCTANSKDEDFHAAVFSIICCPGLIARSAGRLSGNGKNQAAIVPVPIAPIGREKGPGRLPNAQCYPGNTL